MDTAEPATQQPAATLEGTPAAAAGTQGAGETAMPSNIDELRLQSSNLIGMNIQGFGDLTTAASAASSVMVPWERLTVDAAAAIEAKAFVLDVTEATLQNAPPVDQSQLPTFIDPNQVNWETIIDFWESVS